ncbi:MAG: response regulator [Mesorhizobium sp.]|uniref:response regulator transcription factor n=1 Tax=Mesorhizobium sp. TaxID=1871066 RepID=UPI000FE8BC4F|nr:response regulator transcription factor [Mesorhizobium sp.]RWP18508.1 MAG: response regulator [Mesorhizobium sp.]
MKRVLLVEDDPILRSNYETLLSAHRLSVHACADTSSAVTTFNSENFDLVLLDVTLGSDYEAGFELCRQFREKRKEVPIIFLTEHDQDADRISGLRMGADDYLTKTISGSYLVARINALIRRIETLTSRGNDAQVRSRESSSLRLDDSLSRAYWKESPLDLSLTQYWILRELFQNKGEVRSISELMKAANITVQPNTIVVHIKSVREELEKHEPGFSAIKSERARGYRWVEE